MKQKNYIITETKNGVLVKRYFNKVNQNGEDVVNFYYAKRLNGLEKGVYKVSSYIKSKKHFGLKLGVVLVTAIGLTFGGIAFNNISDSCAIKQSSVQSPKVELYKNEQGHQFLTLDSAIQISRYNYNQVKKELENYNKSASESEKFNLDVNMFNYATFVGVQIKESSLRINNSKNGDCKGCFKIGHLATIEANEVSVKLTGKPIIEKDADYDDPIKSSKAAMYIFIKNYEYVYDNIQKHNLKTKIKPEMIIDEYLYGCGNINNEINGSGYNQKQYSKDILDYSDIISQYGKQLFDGGLIYKDHFDQCSEVYSKLNSVTAGKNLDK